MNGTDSYVVFFDLDKTLTGVNSGYALFKAAYSKGLLKKRDLAGPLSMLVLYKAGLKEAGSIITALGSKLKGTGIEEFENLAEEAVKKYILGSIYPEARKELTYHKNNNARIVLLSSAVSGICRSVADHLMIDDVICTEMEGIDGRLTGVPSGNYCYGIEKSHRLIDFCRENGIDLGKAWYYADSWSDIDALQIVGNPVCINPDRRLKKHARRKGWPLRKWEVGSWK